MHGYRYDVPAVSWGQGGQHRPPPAPSIWQPLLDATLASVSLGVAGELGCLIALGTGDPWVFVVAGEVAMLPFLVVGASRLAVLVKQARADIATAGRGEYEPVIIEGDCHYEDDDDNFHLVKFVAPETRKQRRLGDWRWAIDHAYSAGLSSRKWIGQRTPSGVAIDYERWRRMLGEFVRLGIVEGGGDRRAARLAVPKQTALEAFGFAGETDTD